MRNVFLYLLRKSSQILYSILGPKKSTLLSQSYLGKKVIELFLNKNNNIYNGSDGIRLKLSKDEALASGIFHLGVINPHETKIIKKVLKKGDVFIDIGAYVDGWHSLIAGKIVGEAGKVYAFEPVPEYFKKLSENVSLNKLKNITLEKIALSDHNGKQTFYIGGLASTLYKEHLENDKSSHETTTVQTVKLDTYIEKKKIKKISLIKIDAEGAEMDVVRGGRNVLKSNKAPDLIVEVSDVYLKHGNTSESQLLGELRKLGYKPYSITDKGLSKYIKKSEGRELMNVYFSKKSVKELPH